MESPRHFTNIHELFGHESNMKGPIPIIVGKSTVSPCPPENRGARKVGDIITNCINSGILGKQVRTEPQAIIHELNGMAFVLTVFPDETPYYLHARVLTPDSKGNYQYGGAAKLRVEESDRLTVVSGPCLFSAPAVEAIDGRGEIHYLTDPMALDTVEKEIIEIAIDPKLQPYEADSIKKLTKVISSLNGDRDVTVSLNIPRLEYWLYALDIHERGLFDGNLLSEWFRAVNQRSRGLEHLMTRRLPKEFTINSINPLNPAEESIMEALADGEKKLFGRTVDLLRTSDPAWGYVIDREKPTRFVELGYLSYVVAYLQAAKRKRLIVVVENPEETKIMDQTAKLIKGYVEDATFVGLFPHSNAVLNENPKRGKRFLYFFDPPDDSKYSMLPLKEIIRTNRQ